MLRLRNAESGRLEAVPAAPGQGLALRVPAPPEGSGTAGVLPGLLAADLIRRVLGRHRVRVLASYAATPPDGLNLYPPDELADHPTHRPTLLITWTDPPQADATPFVIHPALPDLPNSVVGEGDPLAVRLVLLGRHYTDPGAAGAANVAGAEKELGRWRDAVARWADSPSRPMCAEYLSRFTDACDDDLDTPTALRALRDLEADPELPDGAKFETFVHVDSVLGLDLMRDIGRPR
ncbi:MAG: hypothetical protein GEV11_03955 [Streptosporangiales bacterium]|nr:hypothetical protein [Streptosporangiales bacterium]